MSTVSNLTVPTGTNLFSKTYPIIKIAPPPILQLDWIRQCARSHLFIEIYFNQESHVISFRNQEHIDVNVYYTTGTVGTCVNHPLIGGTCKLFRQNVSHESLLEIFTNPRVHSGTGLCYTSNQYNNPYYSGIIPKPEGYALVLVEDEETTLKKHFQILQDQHTALTARMEACTLQLNALKNARIVEEQKKAAAEQAARDATELLRLQMLRGIEVEQERLRAITAEIAKINGMKSEALIVIGCCLEFCPCLEMI